MIQPSIWDPLKFLEQPILLRKCVYWHLDSEWTNLKPPSTYDLFTGTFPENERTMRRANPKHLDKLRKRLGWFFELYSYLPNLVDSWLAYAECLRYDCVALDYLRMNRELQGSLSLLQWVLVGGQLQLGLFSTTGLLQLWLSVDEYQQLIDTEFMPSTCVNLEHLAEGELRELNDQLQKLELKDTVQQVTFYQEEEKCESKETLELIATLESFKSLKTLKVTNDRLFERLVNFHGFRDFPGHTVGYLVKNRVMELELDRCGSLGTPENIADLTRWETVGKITLNNLDTLDLNHFSLPPGCRWLQLNNIRVVKWWDLKQIRVLLRNILQVQESGIHTVPQRPKIWVAKKSATVTHKDVIYLCKALLWENLGHLNRIQLNNIAQVHPSPVLPKSLYSESQFCWFGNTHNDSEFILL
ncbi:LADA_0G10418g1_1 [Lachancea dasiensis]|uniref:LADA_0G10418g1_1 n=1 Tax=Lachancea dasiensis TaxID=1072105 RepID=A0A1G4JV35_9SACH|nr:LADA_0G10418g1_1 [Lachancea dasiensis]